MGWADESLYVLVLQQGFLSFTLLLVFNAENPVFRLYNSVKLMYALAIFFTYALQFHIPIVIIIPCVQEMVGPKTNSLIVDYVSRAMLVIMTCECIPKFVFSC